MIGQAEVDSPEPLRYCSPMHSPDHPTSPQVMEALKPAQGFGGGARAALWPALLVTVLTGMGFAGLKFVLIGEIALDYKKHAHEPLPMEWMQDVLRRALTADTLDEAITQGLAAVLTFGVLIGYLLNAPLAGAWRVARLFVLSSLGVAAGTLLTLWINPWLITLLVGISYGTACAARGKVVPLLAAAGRRSNTLVSGYVNAALVLSLLAGTVFGTLLHDHLDLSWQRHVVLFGFMLLATALSFLVDPPEPAPIPFKIGMRDLLAGTIALMRERWPFLVGGGLTWGLASAAVLAVFVDAIERLEMKPDRAVTLVVFPALGAILGNLLSHWMDRRRHVIAALVGLALAVGSYPLLVNGPISASLVMIVIGVLFAAPTNVLDARLLAYAAAQGQPGRGSTVMSLVHNIFILLIGSSLALALFLGKMTPNGQFYTLAGVAVVAGLVVLKARLKDHGTAMVIQALVPPMRDA